MKSSQLFGGPPSGPSVRPHVVAAVRGLPARRGVGEPGVRGAGVVRHQVEQHPHAPLVGLRDQLVQVGQRAQLGVDAGVVADVVPPVLVRRRHGGRQPDGVHPEPGQVIEALDDAAQVAVPVVVAVPPGPHVQLVDDGAVPPRRAGTLMPGDLRLAHVPPDPGWPVRSECRRTALSSLSAAVYPDLRIELALGATRAAPHQEVPAATSLAARPGTSRRGTRKAFHPGTGTRARHRDRAPVLPGG